MQDSGVCRRLAYIGVQHDNREIGAHACTLSAEHFGVHLCWCGCAFNDIGEVFMQRSLPLFTEPETNLQ